MAGSGSYSYAQLKAIWLPGAKGTQYATNAWASLMAAIALAESGGNPLATNPTDNNGTQTSWGLFQISNGTHSEVSSSWSDPGTQVQLAIGKLEGQGLSAWGTYDSGAYKQYLSDKTTPDLAGITNISTDAATAAQVTAASKTAADCIWPPNAGSSFRLIPLVGPSVSVPCLLSRSEARALAGAGIATIGAVVLGVGIILLSATAGLEVPARLATAGMRGA